MSTTLDEADEKKSTGSRYHIDRRITLTDFKLLPGVSKAPATLWRLPGPSIRTC